MQDIVSSAMGRMQPIFEEASMKIDTTYPELRQNADLARRLAFTGVSAIPYISSLPPWAREVLGPFLEYTLEFVGVIIRLLLYPLWRLLPSSLQTTISFIVMKLFLPVLNQLFGFIAWYWRWSVASGEYLSQFRVVRGSVLGVLFSLRTMGKTLERHWKVVVVCLSLACFWYLTTPEDLD